MCERDLIIIKISEILTQYKIVAFCRNRIDAFKTIKMLNKNKIDLEKNKLCKKNTMHV